MPRVLMEEHVVRVFRISRTRVSVRHETSADTANTVNTHSAYIAHILPPPPSSTWPHLNSDVGLEEGKY